MYAYYPAAQPTINTHPGEDLHVTLALLSSRKLVFDVSMIAKTATIDCYELKCT